MCNVHCVLCAAIRLPPGYQHSVFCRLDILPATQSTEGCSNTVYLFIFSTIKIQYSATRLSAANRCNKFHFLNGSWQTCQVTWTVAECRHYRHRSTEVTSAATAASLPGRRHSLSVPTSDDISTSHHSKYTSTPFALFAIWKHTHCPNILLCPCP